LNQSKIILSFLQNLLRFKRSSLNLRILSVYSLAILSFILLSSLKIIRKNQVQFKAEDGVLITADHYFSKKNSPYILLLHQERSSRGEFDSIAERFIRLGYNCLAIDLRSGEKYGFVENETAKSLLIGGKSADIMESLTDIKAAVEYTWNLSGQKMILLGSASSASLALIEGKDNEHVRAIIALSPGEYFRPAIEMKKLLSAYPKKVFVGCSAQEYNYVQDMFSEMEGKNKIIFKPNIGPGSRGTSALLRENPTRDEYWLSLLIYFKSLK